MGFAVRDTGNLLTYLFGIISIVACFATISKPGSGHRRVWFTLLVALALIATFVLLGREESPRSDSSQAADVPLPRVERAPIIRTEKPPLPTASPLPGFVDPVVWLQSIDYPGPDVGWWDRIFNFRSRIEPSGWSISGWCWTLFINRTGRELTVGRSVSGKLGTLVFPPSSERIMALEWDSNPSTFQIVVHTATSEYVVTREWTLDYMRIRHYPPTRSEVLRMPTYAFVWENGQVEMVRTSCPQDFAAPGE